MSTAAALTLSLLLLTPQLASSTASCSRRWCRYRMHCMAESLAMTRWSSETVHGCVLRASTTPDDLMLQWNKQTGVCSLFHYQQVCRMMQAGGAEAIGAANQQQALSSELSSEHGALVQCSVYRAKALASCDASLNSHLIGVRLAGGSNRFSNLVCQSDPSASHRLESVNLQWTEEGAQFDGHSSYALLNDSRFVSSDTSASFTWLMRLRREPRVQPIMEAAPFGGPVALGPHFWEFNVAQRLYFYPAVSGSGSIYSQLGQLPNSVSAWVNIGVVMEAGGAASKFFNNGSFTASSSVSASSGFPSNCCRVFIGHRPSSANYLRGAVRAVAIANRSLSEAEIRQFFDLL